MTLAPALARAAPDGSGDPVLKLLGERHLLDEPANAATDAAPASPGLMRQVQERTAGLVGSAMEFIGVRYRRGGTSAETGFDCSGFTRQVFAMSVGLLLPRRADEQAKAAGFVEVKRADLQPGDLVFFNTLRRTFSHVGIYIGNDRFVHAPSSGKRVRTEDMSFAYWAKRFTGARRAAGAGAGSAEAALGPLTQPGSSAE